MKLFSDCETDRLNENMREKIRFIFVYLYPD